MEEYAGLYIHVPFCVKKCGYCDFYSLPADAATRARYAALVRRMLETCPFGAQTFSSVYFGGGTPSLLEARDIAAILEGAARYHRLVRPEITVECNPESAGAAFLADIASAGVNRVSIGLQSSDARTLRFLGRIHTRDDAARAVHSARAAGITNISLDIMLGLPDQTPARLDETLDFCARMDVPHLSAYLLSVEPGTPFARRDAGAVCPGEGEQAALYLQAVHALAARGLAQYEVSNFARPGFESRHNLGYWETRPYLGIGPSAHSLLAGRRFYFPRSLGAFFAAPSPWALRVDDGEGGGLLEYAMLRLRLLSGLDLRQARERGLDAVKFLRRAAPLLGAGLARHEEGRVYLTPEGFLLSNAVIGELLADV